MITTSIGSPERVLHGAPGVHREGGEISGDVAGPRRKPVLGGDDVHAESFGSSCCRCAIVHHRALGATPRTILRHRSVHATPQA